MPDAEAVDVAVGILNRLEQDRVELVGVPKRLSLGGHVHELAVLEKGLGVGEGDREDVRQTSAGELDGEGRALPLVLHPDDVDVGVCLLELLLLSREGLVGGRVRSRRERGDADLGLSAPGSCGAGRERGDRRERCRSSEHLAV